MHLDNSEVAGQWPPEPGPQRSTRWTKTACWICCVACAWGRRSLVKIGLKVVCDDKHWRVKRTHSTLAAALCGKVCQHCAKPAGVTHGPSEGTNFVAV